MEESCDIRITAYKDGRTFQDCREAAEAMVPAMIARINQEGRLPWDEIMRTSEFDAVVYKLALKYLRQAGYDIGSHRRQYVRVMPAEPSPDAA